MRATGKGGWVISPQRYQDQTRACADRGREFVWTAGEQEFFHQQGFTAPPKRCKECRRAKEAARDGDQGRGYSPHSAGASGPLEVTDTYKEGVMTNSSLVARAIIASMIVLLVIALLVWWIRGA